MRTATLLAAFAVAAAGGDGRMKHDFGAIDGFAMMAAPVAVLIRSTASVIPHLLDVARLLKGPYDGNDFFVQPCRPWKVRCRCRGMREVVPVAGSPRVRESQTLRRTAVVGLAGTIGAWEPAVPGVDCYEQHRFGGGESWKR
jgi:hypothetical protein